MASSDKEKTKKTVSKKAANISLGRYSVINEDGSISNDNALAKQISRIRQNSKSKEIDQHFASMWGSGDLGPANIADSNNIGYYNFEFPVDMLELPASRVEELRYYRLAYDRDPIVARAINLNTELPLSKMSLEKPKCSSEEFSDYIFDFFQGLITNTNMFGTLIDATREYWTIGEAFIFVQEPENTVDVCDEAKKVLKKDQTPQTVDNGSEVQNSLEGEGEDLLEFFSKKSNLSTKTAKLLNSFKKVGISLRSDEAISTIEGAITRQKILIRKLAAPPPTPQATTPPSPATAPPPNGQENGGTPAPGEPTTEGEPMGEAGMNDVQMPAGEEPPTNEGAPAAPPMGGGGGGFGGGGGGGFASTPNDISGNVNEAVNIGAYVKRQKKINEAKHYLHLLEKKKDLLEKLKTLKEKNKIKEELFSHIINQDYEGFEKIRILPPEQVDLSNDGQLNSEVAIFYKPPDNQKDAYLQDPETPPEVREILAQEGQIPLNTDPLKGSYAVHFARKKANYELHGRSLLQPCLRCIIYREKLRQVQTTLASRNMTPKTLVVAPGISAAELGALRAHVDEAKADPDYSVITNYECQWSEIGSDGRILALESEWTHTNSDLAIGLGFSPEILIGEGMYSGNRIQLEMLNTTYLQFREQLTHIVEEKIFRPIAMKKGFYELDKWGRPRWIYPKISFSRMALRDSGDLYDMLYNLYSKGSLPVSVIYEFLNMDPETMKRGLEEDLFSVNDSRFNDLMGSIYNSLPDPIIKHSNLVKKILKNMNLDEVEEELEDSNIEGSGEGM